MIIDRVRFMTHLLGNATLEKSAGSNDPVTPAGAVPRLNVTAPVKLVRVIVTVSKPVPPSIILSAAGASDSAYSAGAALTVMVSGVDRLPGLPVPFTVRL